jgi:hypothetical protein
MKFGGSMGLRRETAVPSIAAQMGFYISMKTRLDSSPI